MLLTVVVYHVLYILEDLGVAAVGLGGHAVDVGLLLVKHTRWLGVDDEGNG